MTAQYLTSKKIYAYLSASWVDLSQYVLWSDSISGSGGIRGNKATDILADTGTLSFTLSNRGGEFYPDVVATRLAGWGRFVKIKVEYVFLAETYNSIYYVDKIGLSTGMVDNEATASITCVDWFHFANQNPILAPTILENETAPDGIAAILAKVPSTKQPAATSYPYSTASSTFQTYKTIFDNTGLRTTAYAEISKLVNSEWSSCYLVHDQYYGETLVFENANYRDVNHPVGQISLVPADPTRYKHLLESGDFHMLESNPVTDFVLLEQAAPVLTNISVEFPAVNDLVFDSVEMQYGENIVNRVTVEAVPKRVDIENVVLYNLSNPIRVLAGATIPTFRARYTDPSGGNRVNAIVDDMILPETPGARDTKLMTLLHFNDATAAAFAVDSAKRTNNTTPRHVWRLNAPPMIEADVYSDGFSTQRISGAIVGSWAILGGTANYSITTPVMTSAIVRNDFNFGVGAFTIGWWESRVNPVTGGATMTSNLSAKFPGMLIGRSNGATEGTTDGTNLELFISSNGTSFNIANGKDMGKINLSKWTYREICRAEPTSAGLGGRFYVSADGQIVSTFVSDLAIKSTPLNKLWSIGRTLSKIDKHTIFAYTGFDEFFILKGQCLHKTDFTPPTIERLATLPGDYALNTSSGGLGTDLSDDLQFLPSRAASVTYATEAVTYSGIKNNSASNGYLTFLQARGRGVYQFNPIEDSAEDSTPGGSQDTYGYQTLSIRQPYQQDVTAGMVIADEIIVNEKDPHTDLVSISFNANRSIANMSLFLQCDIGTLFPVDIPSLGIDSYYYVQSKSFTITEGGIIQYTFGLRQDYLH